MMKKKLSSGEWLAIGLTIFYVIVALLTALGMDGSHTAMNKNNIFAGLAELLNMPSIETYSGIWILLIFILVFIIIFAVLVLFLRRFLIKHNEKTYSIKAFAYYSASFASCFAIAIGLGILFQLGEQGEVGGIAHLDTTFGFVFSALLLALLVYGVLLGLFWAIIGVLNYCLRRKPKSINEEDEEKEKLKEELKKKEEEEKADLANSFSDVNSLNNAPQFINGVNASSLSASGSGLLSKELAKKEEVFKNLVAIDNQNLSSGRISDTENITLKDLLDNLQGYLATSLKLYYNKHELAQFIAGLNASKFIILEGVSGTGKSSLPRYFAKFIGEEAYFEAIQVTYKEKSDLLGFYNELTGKYNETPFLENLYKASYEVGRINLVVLDEMNISRVEYYFADFLSVMEFPEEDRRISLMLLPDDYDAPENLEKGQLIITPNTYFIGTANKDDSTFTITDKVIDRAIVIDFENTQKEIRFDKEFTPISLSYEKLHELFKNAEKEYKFKDSERNKFLKVLDFISNELDITIGNRIIRQLDEMVPIYEAMGLTSLDCLDALFTSKILRKLESRYDSSLRNGLTRLIKVLDTEFGLDSFKYSKALINKYLRRSI